MRSFERELNDNDKNDFGKTLKETHHEKTNLIKST